MASASSADAQDRALEVSRVNLFEHAENVRIFKRQKRPRLPVVVVTGFLGSGKTTLLQHLLSNKQNLRIAAAVNDFASLNIDESLIRSLPSSSKASRVVELSNGCICCSLMGSLQDAVWSLLKEGGDVDLDNINYLVIETSGITDPTRIVASLEAKFGKMYRARLDAVVTVVDADYFSQWLRSADAEADSAGTITSPVAVHQLEAADVVVLNKTDLVDPPIAAAVTKLIRQYAPHATVIPTSHAIVPITAVLDVQSSGMGGSEKFGFHTHEKLQETFTPSIEGGFLRPESRRDASSAHQHSHTAHTPGSEFHSLSITLDHSRGPVLLKALMELVSSDAMAGLVRAKGIFWVAAFDGDAPEEGDPLREWRCVVHMSGRAPGRWSWELDDRWMGPPQTEIVFIGGHETLDLKKLEESVRALPLTSRALLPLKPAVPPETTDRLLKQLETDDRFEVLSAGSQESVVFLRLLGPFHTVAVLVSTIGN